MKKISFILTMALAVVLVACNGDKKATEAEATETPAVEAPAVEETTEPVAEKTIAETLKEYEDTAKKMTESLLGIQKGDVKAIQEYQKISPEFARLSSILSEKVSEMTPKEVKQYKEIAERIAKSTPSGN